MDPNNSLKIKRVISWFDRQSEQLIGELNIRFPEDFMFQLNEEGGFTRSIAGCEDRTSTQNKLIH